MLTVYSEFLPCHITQLNQATVTVRLYHLNGPLLLSQFTCTIVESSYFLKYVQHFYDVDSSGEHFRHSAASNFLYWRSWYM